MRLIIVHKHYGLTPEEIAIMEGEMYQKKSEESDIISTWKIQEIISN